MEVKPGYKQTELGVIPEEWNVKSLGEVAELTSSKRIFERDYVPVGVPFFRGKEISKLVEGEAIDGLYFISEARFNSIKSRFGAPARGDILITAVGTLGNVYVVEMDESFYFKDGNLIWLRNIHGIDSRFLGIQLRRAKNAILDGAIGTSQKALTIVVLRNVLVAIPPAHEQRAIEEALTDIDGLLGGLDRFIAKKRDLKQAAMQQLLTGQTRLPGLHDKWEVKTLGEIADVKTGPFGSSLHESDYVQDGTPIITVEHLGEFGVEHFNLPRVSEADHHRLRAYSLEVGDIVFSRVGSVDRNALIRSAEAGWLFSGRLLRVRPAKQKAFTPFLSYQFYSEPFKASVRNVAVGQTMASLNTQILKGLVVNLPSIAEQTAIAEALSDIDAELAALEQRRRKTRDLKQAMMEELLTGKTRLV
jgi:type I restriction enzyme, S subunit